MQAVNASEAIIAVLLTRCGRDDNTVGKLSHLRRRNSRKLKNTLFKHQLVVK
jgi:hypothetical protein